MWKTVPICSEQAHEQENNSWQTVNPANSLWVVINAQKIAIENLPLPIWIDYHYCLPPVWIVFS